VRKEKEFFEVLEDGGEDWEGSGEEGSEGLEKMCPTTARAKAPLAASIPAPPENHAG